MEDDYIRKTPCTREQTPVVVPVWLQEYAQAWGAQGAASVVLYGSRAHGRALTISDWDVVVIFLDQEEVPNKNSVTLPESVLFQHEVNSLVTTLNKVNPTFLREVESGIYLYGDLKLLCSEYYQKDLESIDQSELTRLLANCYKDSLKSLLAINTKWQISEKSIPLVNLFSHDGEAYAARAAEKAVKALCCTYGLNYRYVHDVTALAKQVSPDWFEIVMKMNRSISKVHTLRDLGDYHESCADSLNRIDRTLNLVDRILNLGLFAPSEVERQDLFEEIDDSLLNRQMILAELDVEPHCSDLYRRLDSQRKKIQQIA